MPKFEGLTLWTDKWVSDTYHLTRCERGTYMDLLILMWRSPGCSVPDDDKWLAKHMRMTAAEVQDELRPLIREYCKVQGSRITQKRLHAEFERVDKKVEQKRVAAKLRWQKEKESCKRNASTLDGASRLHMESESESESKIEVSKKEDSATQNLAQLALSASELAVDTKKLREAIEGEFAQFWKAYPRHVGKQAAAKAFARARKTAELATILGGLERVRPGWTDPQYTPHPATWLNRGGWEDELGLASAAEADGDRTPAWIRERNEEARKEHRNGKGQDPAPDGEEVLRGRREVHQDLPDGEQH